MNDLLVQNEIGSRIFTLRGKEVMIDRDLAVNCMVSRQNVSMKP